MSTKPARRGLRAYLSFVLSLGALTAAPTAAVLLTPATAHATVATGDIFIDTYDANYNNVISVRKSDGSVTQLTGAYAFQPDVSPDGSRVAYLDSSSGYYGISVINSDGTGLIPYTTHNAQDGLADRNPRWSPDDSKLAFVRCAPNIGTCNINVLNVDGTTTVTPLMTDGTAANSVSWSPDGTRLAYDRLDPNGYSYQTQIWVMNADGTNNHRVTAAVGTTSDNDPAWSPDGSRIYYWNTGGISYFSSSNSFTNTTAVTSSQLTTSGVYPKVSGDGSAVYFTTAGGNGSVMSVASSGGTPSQISNTSQADGAFSVAKGSWPPVPPSNSTVSVGSPTAHDAPYTRQITIGLSATGNKQYDYGWSTSSTTAPNTSYLQHSTDMTGRHGTLNYLGVYSGSGTTWNGGTQPDQDWYLWVRSVQNNGTPNAWGTPLKVHTPRRPVWVGIGDSYSSGHHQDQDEPWCPQPNDTNYVDYQTYFNCPSWGAGVTPNDLNYSWVKKAVDQYNAAIHAPTDPATGWSYGLDLVAFSGALTASFGVANTTPGTDAWATGTGQSANIRSDLYSRYTSWNIVSMTGGADDTNWASVLGDFYHANFVTASPSPWAVTSNPTANCPNSQSIWNWLKATQLDGNTLDADIQANLQGVVTVATRYAPGARVLNVGYPYVVDSTNVCAGDQNSGSWHGSKSVIGDLNSDHQAVTGSNVHYLDLTSSSGFGQNPVSAGDLQLRRLYGYPHPVDTGQTVIANYAVGNLTGSW